MNDKAWSWNKTGILILKGILMGLANVIPGVSGGTIALITDIYEEFILSLKRMNLRSFLMFVRGRWGLLSDYLNLPFILPVTLGILISVFGIANIFQFMFREYPVYIWSLFFGIIAASVYYIGRDVKTWDRLNHVLFALGTLLSVGLAFLPAAQENDAAWYILFSGAVSISGMTFPGLSGSFLLILMGNYKLLLIDSVANINPRNLLLFGLGSILGLVLFSNILVWILRRAKDRLIATLSGFVLGSLLIIWPWQVPDKVIENVDGNEVVLSYSRYLPSWEMETLVALAVMFLGAFSIWYLERSAEKRRA
jgi:putative membrane protein